MTVRAEIRKMRLSTAPFLWLMGGYLFGVFAVKAVAPLWVTLALGGILGYGTSEHASRREES